MKDIVMRIYFAELLIVIGCFCLAGCDSKKVNVIKASSDQLEKERIKQSIELVLEQDRRTNDGVQRVFQVVARMRAIDTSSCPRDFRTAYLAHIHAWEVFSEVEQQAIAFKAEASSDAVLVESLIRGSLGDPLGKSNEIQTAKTQLQRNYQAASLQVKQTFHRVEELTIIHGANLPK